GLVSGLSTGSACRRSPRLAARPPRGRLRHKARFGLVEAAGVEPASEAASSGTSTSVSGILVLAWRLLPTGSASASHGDCPTSGPWRPRGSDPVYVTPLPSPPD